MGQLTSKFNFKPCINVNYTMCQKIKLAETCNCQGPGFWPSKWREWEQRKKENCTFLGLLIKYNAHIDVLFFFLQGPVGPKGDVGIPVSIFLVITFILLTRLAYLSVETKWIKLGKRHVTWFEFYLYKKSKWCWSLLDPHVTARTSYLQSQKEPCITL